MSEREPIHEPALPYIDEEVEAIHAAADRFEHATAPRSCWSGRSTGSIRGWRSAPPAASTAWR